MTTNVLILCTHNSARSVLSEGMLNHLTARTGRDVRAFSAGSAPSGRIPSNTPGTDEDRRATFELTRQAIGYRMLRLLQLPFENMDDATLRGALIELACQ